MFKWLRNKRYQNALRRFEIARYNESVIRQENYQNPTMANAWALDEAEYHTEFYRAEMERLRP